MLVQTYFNKSQISKKTPKIKIQIPNLQKTQNTKAKSQKNTNFKKASLPLLVAGQQRQRPNLKFQKSKFPKPNSFKC
jgi:hypothetical protein